MRRAAPSVAAALLLAPVSSTVSPPPAAASGAGNGASAASPYVVVLRQAPVASYQGGLAGYPRTAPTNAHHLDADAPAAVAYRAFVVARQRALVARVGNPEVLYSYTTAIDGLAIMATPAQVKALNTSRQVLLVQPDTTLRVDGAGRTSGSLVASSRDPATTTPGADAPTSLWHQVGGADQAGRGVVIGVVDSGVWPDSPSLAGIPTSPATVADRYPDFHGTCQTGFRWTTDTCDSKVIAARYFVRGFGRDNVARSDYLSPRDGSGHGTAVAAVAAGNAGVDTRIGGQDFGHISGQAPAAGISVYKACWTAPDPARDGCDLADVLMAVDQAVRDGVDVLNYSIGSSATSLADPVQLAFLNAAAAGVFVAAPAGNGGPAPGSVQHPAPWVTTVGATTHAVYQGGVQLGNGHTLVGAMLSNRRVGPAPLLDGAEVAAPGVPPSRAALCFPRSLDAQQVERAIVVCDRGVTSRVSKSAAVAQAGGRGMVLVNTKPGSVDADVHAVPTVHLDEQSGAQVKAYLAASPGDAVATLLPGVTSHPTVPTVARFSGRGPDPAVGGDVLKPDLTAPGVGVVTAVAPSADRTQLWDVETGSSIATPAVAGVAAVIHGARPAWSPATIQSALMTSARPLAVDHGPMSRGAGQLDAAGVLAPGLVYDAGLSQWGRLLREQGIRVWGYGTGASRLSAVQVNAPAISVGDLVGPLTVTRTVTNVGTTTATYTADISGLRGIGRAISPSSLTLAPGRSADFHVTFAATRLARYGSFTTGTLTWRTGSGAAVSTPVAVRPQLAAPTTEVTGHGRSGTVIVGGRAGVTGTLHLVASGLVGATPVSLDLRPGPFDPSSPATSAATAAETLHVARGARAARFQVISRQPADDLDIYVYLGPRLVASADGRSADETVTLTKPAPGRYRIYVTAHAAANDATAHGWFTSWVLPHADAGNLTLDRRFLPVVGGERFGVGVHWSGLDPRQRWWGYVACRGLPGVTYLTVN